MVLNSSSARNTAMLIRAIRWWMNRSRIMRAWLRASMVMPWAAMLASGRTCGPGGTDGAVVARSWMSSGIPDPWVKERVHDVRENVEDNDSPSGHDQPALDDVDVRADPGPSGQRVVEQGSHPVPAVDDLGNHHAAEQAGEVERYHGGDRDQGIAQRVHVEHPPRRQPLRPGQPHVVGVQHVEQRGTLEPAP